MADLARRLAALPEAVRAQIVAMLKTERVPKNWERGVGILCVGKKPFFSRHRRTRAGLKG